MLGHKCTEVCAHICKILQHLHNCCAQVPTSIRILVHTSAKHATFVLPICAQGQRVGNSTRRWRRLSATWQVILVKKLPTRPSAISHMCVVESKRSRKTVIRATLRCTLQPARGLPTSSSCSAKRRPMSTNKTAVGVDFCNWLVVAREMRSGLRRG